MDLLSLLCWNSDSLFQFNYWRRFYSEFLTHEPKPPVLRARVGHTPGLADLGLSQPLWVPGHEDGAVWLSRFQVTEGGQQPLQPLRELRARATH